MVVKKALFTGIEPSALTNRGIMNEMTTERKALTRRTRDTGILGTAGTINTVITADGKMTAGIRATKGTTEIAGVNLRERAKASNDVNTVFCYTREGTKVALAITKSAIDAVREDITRDLGSVRARTRGTPTTGDRPLRITIGTPNAFTIRNTPVTTLTITPLCSMTDLKPFSQPQQILLCALFCGSRHRSNLSFK